MRRLALLGASIGLVACSGASAPVESSRAPVRAVVPVANCPEAFPQAGGGRLSVHTVYLAGRRRRYDRARVSIGNFRTKTVRVRIPRAIVCRAGLANTCALRRWVPVDRTLAPGQTFHVDVDARMPLSRPGEAYVVSLVGAVDGHPWCRDVAAWIAVTDPGGR